MFFWNSLAFSLIQQMLAIFSLAPLLFLKPPWISGSSRLLRPGLENFERYFTSMWGECNCAVVWAFFGIAFLRDWNENWPFPVLWPLLSFQNLLAYGVQYEKFSVFLISCAYKQHYRDYLCPVVFNEDKDHEWRVAWYNNHLYYLHDVCERSFL